MRRSLLILVILFLVLALAGAGCTTTPVKSAAPTTPPISNQSANITANASVPNITGRWSGLTDGYVQGSVPDDVNPWINVKCHSHLY